MAFSHGVYTTHSNQTDQGFSILASRDNSLESGMNGMNGDLEDFGTVEQRAAQREMIIVNGWLPPQLQFLILQENLRKD